MAGISIAASTYAIGQFSDREMNPVAPILVASLAGFGKETIDAMTTGRWNGKDFAFTVASAAITNLVMHYVWKKNKSNDKIEKSKIIANY
jgi:hypothetical protein